ncbi:DUF1593 domain-containing protein [Flammeovirgaceae bacterium SG7u.111]|nr:DUF1593 domain-containing protein [Flammeovirgaceae bacterium SG7u.132]WPO33172.1 DUF1593 domain-containing protein [Flammeovirgaceae bacterium SG7u.111]
MHKLLSVFTFILIFSCSTSTKEVEKPRIIISSDIGGTDPDDNQSMIYFLMYSDMFQTEGLISSPSYGEGSKEEIIKMIDLYQKDLPKLKEHSDRFPTPESLRAICKQGRKGAAPFVGYQTATEGSDWIIKCAQKESEQPLWVLVWGGLDDVAQALHDAPEIRHKIKVYWIGGPNKKWSTNSYAYIVENFPDLWFIEANAVYRGFFSNTDSPDSLRNEKYYANFIDGAGHMANAFKNYYGGGIKMGDTPSLLYAMNGNPLNPLTESWGGSFEKFTHSSRSILNCNTTLSDTIPVYSIIEYHFKSKDLNIPTDSACLIMSVGGQNWSGYHLGNGEYVVRYAPKKAETLSYEISSGIPELNGQKGQLVVSNVWPGNSSEHDYKLGDNWYTDPSDPALFDNGWQGAKTVLKWRRNVLLDWAERWEWLK